MGIAVSKEGFGLCADEVAMRGAAQRPADRLLRPVAVDREKPAFFVDSI